MNLVFSFDSMDCAHSLAQASLAADARSVGTWHDVLTYASQCRCIILGCYDFTAKIGWDISCLGRAAPHASLILITHPQPEQLVQLKDLSVAHVLWWDQVDRLLPGVISGLRVDSLLQAYAFHSKQARHLPARVSRAMAFVFGTDPPPRTVKALAAHLAVGRRSLERDWRDAFAHVAERVDVGDVSVSRSKGALNVAALVDTVVVGRALIRRRERVQWRLIEAELGVSARSIRKYAIEIGLTPALNSADDEAEYRLHLASTLNPLLCGNRVGSSGVASAQSTQRPGHL
jgi:hypothetical protein